MQVWNNKLAQKAQTYADMCIWGHSTSDFRKTDAYSWVGENLAATTGAADYPGLVQNWYDEVKDYDYNTGACSNVCGHYTQVNTCATLHSTITAWGPRSPNGL